MAQEYEKAKQNSYVQKPLAYALYKVWRLVDAEEKKKGMTQERNCENCAHADRPAYEYPCTACESLYDCPPTKWEAEAKPQTNADHIRAMTDEKLAELFAGMCQSNADGESRCYACLFNAWCPACGYTDDWLEWLQQPYKENEGESK